MGKITKDISKLNKLPHPNSRKTAKLAKKIVKQDHRSKTKQAHSVRTNLSAEKYLWFKNEFDNVETCTPEILSIAITKYLKRFDEELEQIQLKHDIGGKRNRQHANREDIVKMTKSNEDAEFNGSGIELPDVMNPKQFQLLKTWNGELRFLQNFKLTRFSKTKLESLKSKYIPPKITETPKKVEKVEKLSKMDCDV